MYFNSRSKQYCIPNLQTCNEGCVHTYSYHTHKIMTINAGEVFGGDKYNLDRFSYIPSVQVTCTVVGIVFYKYVDKLIK